MTTSTQVELPRLLRLRSMIESAASAVPDDGASAHALTESYARTRNEVRRLIADTQLVSEFDAAFPEIEVVEVTSRDPWAVAQSGLVNEPAARRAKLLLGQLAGWVGGLIDEQTLDRRLQLEAQERVRQEG